MDKNLESAYTPDLYNTFVDTPESDIPENLRDSVFLDAKKDPAFKRLFGDARLVCDVIKYIFIRLPRMEKFKDSIAPEELAWYELIANSERCREIPETATELIRDTYER